MTRKYRKQTSKKSYAPRNHKLNTQKQVRNRERVEYMPETEVYRGYVAGVGHYDYKKVESKLKAGQPVQLVGEPNNQYDKCAIRVDLDGHKLGYVSARDGSNKVLWEYKKGRARFRAEIASYNENNPSYTAISIVVYIAEPAPETEVHEATDGCVTF